MNAYPAKVNRTVNYKTAAGRWRPAVITSVINATTANLRVGHHGETYAAKVRRTGGDVQLWYDPAEAPRTDADKWRPG